MSEKAVLMAVVGCVGLALTIARRWGNDDANAGLGAAGWTLFAIISLALS
jgi:hypothetical protein